MTGFAAVENNGIVTLGWDLPTGLSVGAAIYRAASSDGPFTLIGRVPNDLLANYFPDFDVTNGTTYYYQARPMFADGSVGEPSASIAATPSATSSAAVKLVDILNILLAHPSTGQAPFIEDVGALIQSRNIPMGFTNGTASNVLGFFDPQYNAFFLSQATFNKSVNALAEVMAHEGTHAWFHFESAAAEAATLNVHPALTQSNLHISTYPGNSIDQEYHAFMAGFRLWNQVDDGSDPSLTTDANFFLSAPEELLKQLAVRPTYADLGLPEF